MQVFFCKILKGDHEISFSREITGVFAVVKYHLTAIELFLQSEAGLIV